jgi:hypothetical protein
VEVEPVTGRHPAARGAGALLAALGAAFGPSAIWATMHLRRTGELPLTPFGFRALSGPFERLGHDRFSALAIALSALSALNVVAGVWLWRGERRGLRLGLATFVPTMALAAGFALPFLLVGLPVSAVLAFAGRRSLSPGGASPTPAPETGR